MAKFTEIWIPEVNNNTDIAITTVIYGKPKVGKTTLATTSQELGLTLLLNFENRVNHIIESPDLIIYPGKNKICKEENIINLIGALRQNADHGIKYIIFDTVDSLFFNLEKEIFNSKNKVNITFDERKAINLKINNMIEVFKVELNINVILTLHEKKSDQDNKTSLALANDFKTIINKYSDNIFYLDLNVQKQRVLVTKPNCLIEAGQSTPLGQELPDEIVEPTWAKIFGVKNNGN